VKLTGGEDAKKEDEKHKLKRERDAPGLGVPEKGNSQQRGEGKGGEAKLHAKHKPGEEGARSGVLRVGS